MTTNNHILYEGSVSRTFSRERKEHTIFSIPIYFTAFIDADLQVLQEALLKRYNSCEALYTPQRFTNPVFKVGQEDKIIPLEIMPVTDSQRIASLEKRV